MVAFYDDKRQKSRKQPHRKNIDIDYRETQETTGAVKQQHQRYIQPEEQYHGDNH